MGSEYRVRVEVTTPEGQTYTGVRHQDQGYVELLGLPAFTMMACDATAYATDALAEDMQTESASALGE